MKDWTCNHPAHKRIGWLIASLSLTGLGSGVILSNQFLWGVGELAVLLLLWGFTTGVYLGVIKLEKPKRKPKAEPQGSQPTQPTTRE